MQIVQHATVPEESFEDRRGARKNGIRVDTQDAARFFEKEAPDVAPKGSGTNIADQILACRPDRFIKQPRQSGNGS